MVFVTTDVETWPIADVADHVEPVNAPGNYKDEQVIAEYIERKLVERAGKASLDPDLCRLAAIGWMFEGEDRPTVIATETEEREREALEQFWRAIDSDDPLQAAPRIITFNGFRFDLLVIMRRSDFLGIPYRPLNIDRYKSPHVDLYHRLTFGGAAGTTHSLRFYAKRWKIPIALPEVDGTKIAALAANGQWNEICAHCADDITITHELARKVNVFGGALRAAR